MSKDLPEGVAFKEDLGLYRYCSGNLNFSTVSNDDEEYGYQKKKIMRDPMSHRIIEKRRRDRMNNCLADLSRLIPPDYLKKGRGRIEKTEIIEMAIKHMRHLQSIISSSRTNEVQCENPATSPADRNSNRDFGVSETPTHQPIIMEHYRLGYLECLSEAMHFLVEVQGYFAGDSLCVQMINHLHKHCDKILKSDSLNHPRKHSGETTSNSSSSPRNGNYSNNSPPLGLSVSTGSNSDDNQPNLPYENGRTFESAGDRMRNVHAGFRSPRRYSDLSSRERKKNCESYYLRYSETETERISENPSDSDLEQGYCTSGRSKDGKNYANACDDSPKCTERLLKNCSSSSGIGSNELPYEEVFVKDENGSSQLRDMLTSPKAIHPHHASGTNSIPVPHIKRSGTLIPHVLGYQSLSNRQNPDRQELGPSGDLPHCPTDIFNCKPQNLVVDAEDCAPQEVYHQNPCTLESSAGDSQSNMYKFKNNIKQRFSKERRNRHDSDEENFSKKAKLLDLAGKNLAGLSPRENVENDGSERKYPYDPLVAEKLDLLRKVEEECEKTKKNRNSSECEVQMESEMDDISNRLSFGHKTSNRFKKWDENVKLSKLKLSPPYLNPDIPIVCKTSENGRRPIGLLTITEYLPSEPTLLHKFDRDENERRGGIPVFALHSKGSFYIPLTLDQGVLTPFLSLLGLTKPEEVDEKPVLHPVTISVNFQTSYLPGNPKHIANPWK